MSQGPCFNGSPFPSEAFIHQRSQYPILLPNQFLFRCRDHAPFRSCSIIYVQLILTGHLRALTRAAPPAALRPWEDKHLDEETDEFRDQPSTGENIVRTLWPKFDERLRHRLVRLRLWETPNNRFSLRLTTS